MKRRVVSEKWGCLASLPQKRLARCPASNLRSVSAIRDSRLPPPRKIQSRYGIRSCSDAHQSMMDMARSTDHALWEGFLMRLFDGRLSAI